MKKTLQDITEVIMELEEKLDELEGDITGQEDLIAEYMGTMGELSEKAQGYCQIISQYESRAKIRKEEAKRVADLAEQDDREAKRLRERLKYFLEVLEIDKLETDLYKISLRNAGQAALVIDDEEMALKQYGVMDLVMTKEGKKQLIADVKAGTCSVAHYAPKKKSLIIK